MTTNLSRKMQRTLKMVPGGLIPGEELLCVVDGGVIRVFLTNVRLIRIKVRFGMKYSFKEWTWSQIDDVNVWGFSKRHADFLWTTLSPKKKYAAHDKRAVVEQAVVIGRSLLEQEREFADFVRRNAATKPCPHCRQVIPATSDECPECGRQVR